MIESIKKWAEPNDVFFDIVFQGLRVLTTNKKQYNLIKEKLYQQNFEFFSYSLTEDKAKHLMLRFRDNEYLSCDMIDNALRMTTKHVLRVREVKVTKNNGQLVETDLFQISFAPAVNLRDIRNIKFISGYRTIWETYNAK